MRGVRGPSAAAAAFVLLFAQQVAADPIPNEFEAVANSAGTDCASKGRIAWEAAVADTTKALESAPGDSHLLFDRSVANFCLGRFQAQIADFDALIAAKPDSANLYYNRAVGYLALNDTSHAMADLNKAIALQPDYAEAHNNRGSLYSELGDSDRAIADLTIAAKLQPDDYGTSIDLGNVYLETKRYDLAATAYAKAAAQRPNDTQALYFLALADYDGGKFADAIAVLDKSLVIDPRQADTLYARGQAKTQSGDQPGGQDDRDAADRMYPGIAAQMAKSGYFR